MKFSKDEQFIVTASGAVGVHVINISDLYNPKLVFTWNLNNSGTLENVKLTQDNNYIFGAVRSYGCIILNFEDKTK